MKLIYKLMSPVFVITFLLILCGWGSTGHRLISTDATFLFKGKAEPLSYISNVIINHASDADSRKSSDPTESPKHFIDIDTYPEFISTGRISMDYDSVVALHGQNFVIDAGTLPWAILNTFDSLKAAFSRNDWNKAGYFAADLGHYVGDSHMPLHITGNYNGYQTGQGGVHSRYETDLINNYSSQIKYNLDSLSLVPDVKSYVFTYIYHNYIYVDSVLNADKEATSFAGTNKGSVYLAKFWELAGTFTDSLFKNASNRLADLIYTAWVEAGSPVQGVTAADNASANLNNLQLRQNYPNPFNPITTISYSIPKAGNISIKIYDETGREVATLMNGFQTQGEHQTIFNGQNLASGVYFYRLSAGAFNQVKKLMLLK